jgi:hypothetical protein
MEVYGSGLVEGDAQQQGPHSTPDAGEAEAAAPIDHTRSALARLPGGESAALRQRSRRLARPLVIERVWTPDQAATVAALRVVLDLPRQLPDRGLGGVR